MRDDRFSIWGHGSTELFVGFSLEVGRADEIVDHFDFPINPKQFERVALEAVGNRCDGIGLIDGVGNDRFKGGILAEQGDVRSVKRGDDGQVDAFLGEDVAP